MSLFTPVLNCFAHLGMPSYRKKLRIDLEHTEDQLLKAEASLERAQAEVACYTKRKARLERKLAQDQGNVA